MVSHKVESVLVLATLVVGLMVGAIVAMAVGDPQPSDTFTVTSTIITTTSYFMQRLTTFTSTSVYSWDTLTETVTARWVCGNVPWNDSIYAHCGIVPIPEFPSEPIAFAVAFVVICMFVFAQRRTVYPE